MINLKVEKKAKHLHQLLDRHLLSLTPGPDQVPDRVDILLNRLPGSSYNHLGLIGIHSFGRAVLSFERSTIPQKVPQHIILAEFGARPFRLETVFSLVSFLHRIQSFADSAKGRDRYPYLTSRSSETISFSSPWGRFRGWFAGVLNL